jgi:asparagine synthase (glutamine-hydrolysing)
MTSGAVVLSRQERATGVVCGADEVAPIRLPASSGDPRSALFQAVFAPLSHSPCVISFSGGWDSSLILAVAVGLAREHGLALPLPITIRFPGQALADESGWQELVIEHLGLKEWRRIEVTDELDFLGDIACDSLESLGLLWPPNAHFHAPIFGAAQGGAALTGFDGDGLFEGWRWARQWAVLRRHAPARPRDGLWMALALAPAPLRRMILAAWSEPPLRISWLKPDARSRFLHEFALEGADEPRRWDRRVPWYSRRRWVTLTVQSLGLLAERHGAQVVHPLLDPRFLAALASDGGYGGYGNRAETIWRLFGDLLPARFFARHTKAVFGRALWGPRARAFAAAWDGAGVDHDLVDVAALRSSWALASPPLGAATLLQGAWLSAQEKQPSTASDTSARAEGS